MNEIDLTLHCTSDTNLTSNSERHGDIFHVKFCAMPCRQVHNKSRDFERAQARKVTLKGNELFGKSNKGEGKPMYKITEDIPK